MKILLCAALAASLALAADIKVVLVGDSTVNDQGGWGVGFRQSFASNIQVLNLAKNGRSSKSFRAEGLWTPALKTKPDYILIQFGHNDEPGKGPDRETNPATTYRQNMIRYVEEARAEGAKPILVTSIVRRNFSPDGTIKPDSLALYVEQVRAIAREMDVPLIDLYTLTKAQAEMLGPQHSFEIGAKTKQGAEDTTHLGPRGQREIGRIAAREFARLVAEARASLLPIHYVVAQDGSGDSKTIQYAIDHAPTIVDGERLIIEIRPGTYHERLVLPKTRSGVTFLGTDAATTIITAGMSAKEAGGTFLSNTVDVEGDDFWAENVTFENSFGVGSQAVAISLHSDRAIFRRCRFLGWQDTLYSASGRQYFQDCYIAGHVDFIFGNATAVFENCEIHSRGAGYITAQSRTSPGQSTGFVFRHCRLTGENTGKGVFLGRPWRPYARVVYLDCFLGDHIRPEGWDNWNNNAANEKTAWYGEFRSMGPGANSGERAGWSRQLTPDQVLEFATEQFLKGSDGWNPGVSAAK